MNWAFNSSDREGENELGFVLDADNAATVDGVRGFINIPTMGRLLRNRGVTQGVICSNWFRPMEELLWGGLGMRCRAAHKNCDDIVAEEVERFVEAGFKHILLGSGDGRAFCSLTASLRARGVQVHILARERSCSRELCRLATGFAFLDRFVAVAPCSAMPAIIDWRQRSRAPR